MADPTANQEIVRRGDSREIRSYPMDGGVQTLYIGQAVMQDATGYAVKGADTAGCRFRGIAIEKVAQAASVSDGTNEIDVQVTGDIKVTVTSVAVTDMGKPVWLSDSQTYILTPTNIFVGWVEKYVSSGKAFVTLAGDYQPSRYDLTLAIPVSAASGTKTSGLHTFARPAIVLAASVNGLVYPNYDSSVVDVDKYDLGTTADKAVVAATDIDNKTAKTAIALTLTATGADLLMAVGDSIRASQTLGANEVAASDGLSVTLEMLDYGLPNV